MKATGFILATSILFVGYLTLQPLETCLLHGSNHLSILAQ